MDLKKLNQKFKSKSEKFKNNKLITISENLPGRTAKFTWNLLLQVNSMKKVEIT